MLAWRCEWMAPVIRSPPLDTLQIVFTTRSGGAMRCIKIDPHDAIIDGTCKSQRRRVVNHMVHPASGRPDGVTLVFATLRPH